jgi:hypothetical protein
MTTTIERDWEQIADSNPKVNLRIEGPAFSRFYPAERVGVIVLAIEKLVRFSMRAASDDEEDHLSRLELLATFPRRGSYLQELVPIWNVATEMAKLMPPLIPLIPDAIEQLKKSVELFAASYLRSHPSRGT